MRHPLYVKYPDFIAITGVIAVETNTIMMNIPADPGAPDSSERVVPQAGQVWFPDSALKTAHAMEEFDREALPLIVLANWRGFSGGQRDLFEGVLQVFLTILISWLLILTVRGSSWLEHGIHDFKAYLTTLSLIFLCKDVQIHWLECYFASFNLEY